MFKFTFFDNFQLLAMVNWFKKFMFLFLGLCKFISILSVKESKYWLANVKSND